MGRPNDKEAPPPAEAPAEVDRPGRVVVDNRGRNVWQWAKSAVDSTSILLKRLENKDLALEPTQKVPVMPGADPKGSSKAPRTAKPGSPAKPGAKPADDRMQQKGAKRSDPFGGKGRGDKGGGFDPYNSR